MTTTELDHPAKVKMVEILISLEEKEEDIIGLFVNIEIFENIFIGGVTGSITIMDSDSQDFIGKNNIEFVEDISFTFVDCNNTEFKFEGHLNGLRNEIAQNQVKLYTVDFSSKAVRKNEMVSINKAFRDVTPEEIIKEMVDEKLESELITGSNTNNGHPMTWVAGNRKPIDVIRYVLNHGISTDGNPQYEVDDKSSEGKSSGSSGFLCWETLEGYRFCSMGNLLKEGNFTETHKDYANYIANTSGGKEIKSKTIMTYDFPKVGDYFEKLRSGAVKSRHVSFDMDTGIMTNFNYDATTEEVTQKVLDLTETPTRTVVKMFSNERFKKDCQKESRDVGDQSRMYLSQTIAKQNTFSDTHGRITLPARYDIRAGDLIDIKIYKLKSENTDEQPHEKHSGIYMISQVGNHFFRDGHSYTKLALIRTNIQQDEGTAQS